MNQIDDAYRNRKDVAELMEIAQKATDGFIQNAATMRAVDESFVLHCRLESLAARRAREDGGGVEG